LEVIRGTFAFIISPKNTECKRGYPQGTTSLRPRSEHSSFIRRRGLPPLLVEEGLGVVIQERGQIMLKYPHENFRHRSRI
jgi:hypothetical protein